MLLYVHKDEGGYKMDLTLVNNEIRDAREEKDNQYKEELKNKGMLTVAFTKDAEPLTNAIMKTEKGYQLNQTLFAHNFLNMFSLYAHPSLGGQWLYDEETGLWNDLDLPKDEYASGIYQQLVKPLFYDVLMEMDNDGRLAKALQSVSVEIANTTKAQGLGTGLGAYKNDGLVLFNDGRVYDFDLKRVREVKKTDYMTKRFDYPIIENEDGGLIKEWLDFVLEDSAPAFYEYIGSAFIQRPIYNVFAFAVNGLLDENTASNGGNGKSEVLGFLQNKVFGIGNTSSLPLQDLIQADDKKIINLYQKFLNIDAETPETFINDTSKLKGLTGTGARTVDRKYKTSITMENRAKLLFATNSVPQFRDDSSAMERRLMIIPFNRDFKGKDAEAGRKYYTKELRDLRASTEELGKFAYYCLKRFEELYSKKGASANNPFSMSDTALRLRDKTISENNPALYFINECPYVELTNDDNDMVHQGLLYAMYKASNKEDMKKLVSKQVFKKYLAEHIKNGDKTVKNTTERNLGATHARVYTGIRLVKPSYEDIENEIYLEPLLKHYAKSDEVNILDILPIGGE
jgi:hypothetical protein